MITGLGKEWTIVDMRPRGSMADLANLRSRFTTIPPEYLGIASDMTEYNLKHSGGQYLRIWPPATLLEMDTAHHISRRLPGAIPIGDDGGDQVILYIRGGQGFGLYRVPFGALDYDELHFVAPTLMELLADSIGVLPNDIW